MAVNLPSGLFNAYTEVLDSSPTANRFAQEKARRQARMDALDEYDRNRINSINSTGVRDNDRQGFDERLQKIQTYYGQNKDKIRKGGSPESYEYEKMFRDVGSYINQSKERTAKQDAAMKFYNDKLKLDGRVPDDFMVELEENDKGIDEIVGYDATQQPQRSKTFDLKKWMTLPKPYNQQVSLKAYNDIKRTPTVRTEPVPGNLLKVNEITEETFDDGAKQVIAIRAANDFQNSHSFSDAVLTDVKDPVTRGKLEATFKDSYGTMPQSNEDYAAAYRLQELQPKIVKNKLVDNKDAIMTRREKMQREIQDRIDKRQQYGIAARRQFQIQDQLAQDDYVETMWDAYKKKGSLDPQVVADYQKTDGKGHKVPINKTVFNPDETVDFIVYKLDKKGNPTTEVDDEYSTKGVPPAQIKARIRKELETPMTNTGGQQIRPPKNITNTKMTPKPTKPKPY